MPLSNPNGNPLAESEPNHVDPIEIIEPMQVDKDITENHEHIGDEDESNKIEDTEKQFHDVMEKIKALYFDRIKHDATGYAKAFKTLEMHIDRMPKTNDSALQDAVFKFGENSTKAVTPATRKKGKNMRVQSTAISRRFHAIRGSQAALRGAPRKGHTGSKKETDENGIVRYKLPGAKKKKTAQNHLLSSAVEVIRGASKKH